jgi:hypothetical protein
MNMCERVYVCNAIWICASVCMFVMQYGYMHLHGNSAFLMYATAYCKIRLCYGVKQQTLTNAFVHGYMRLVSILKSIICACTHVIHT